MHFSHDGINAKPGEVVLLETVRFNKGEKNNDIELANGDRDFTISRLSFQLRYRWEIAPLTDLFLVYNRGNSLPNQFDASFDDLFSDVFDEPIIDSFVAKIRWRFGN